MTKDGFVKLIDFGISMSYVNDNKKDVEEHKSIGRYGFQGTPLYGSIRSLDGYTQSRRDDLEALGYVFMCMIDEDRVSWRQQGEQKEIMKAKTRFLELPENSDQISIMHRTLHKFVNYCYGLGYETNPNYAYLHDLLSHVYDDFELEIQNAVDTVLTIVLSAVTPEVLADSFTKKEAEFMSQVAQHNAKQ